MSNPSILDRFGVLLKPLGLADILLAIKSARDSDIISHSDSYEAIADLCYRDMYWDLTKNFQNQSIETKKFIGELLNFKE